MDVLGYLKTNPTLGDVLDLLPYAERTELLALRDWIRNRRAEVDLPIGQLVGLTTEGETTVSPWKIVRASSPAWGAAVDVVTAGSFPSVCITEEGWEQGHRIDSDGERLHVAVNASHGYELRPLEAEDPEVAERA